MTEQLDFNRMWSCNAENDKESTLTIGVYNGRAFISVFSGNNSGGPKFKQNLSNRLGWEFIPHALRLIRDDNSNNVKKEINITSFNPTTKKAESVGCIIIGRDDKGQPYIGITGSDIKPLKFLIRAGLQMDTTSFLSVAESQKCIIDAFINVFTRDIPHAVNLTSYKVDFKNRRAPQNNSHQDSSSNTSDDEIPF